MDPLVILAATAALFVIGGVYYGLIGDRLAAAGGTAAEMQPWAFGVELARCLVLAAAFIAVASEAGVATAGGGLALGAALWVGFPFVLWTGAIVHERTPVALAAIHAGDWLIKLLVVGVLAGVLA